MNFTESIKKIDANEIDYSFESFKKVEEAIQKHEFTDKKIVLMSSVPSEIEKLKEKYKTESMRIKNIGKMFQKSMGKSK